MKISFSSTFIILLAFLCNNGCTNQIEDELPEPRSEFLIDQMLSSKSFQNYINGVSEVLDSELRSDIDLTIIKLPDNVSTREETISALNRYFACGDDVLILLEEIKASLLKLKMENRSFFKSDEEFLGAIQTAVIQHYSDDNSNVSGYCEEALARARTACDEGAAIGAAFCFLTLPTGWGYFLCWGALTIDGISCISAAEKEYEKYLEAVIY